MHVKEMGRVGRAWLVGPTTHRHSLPGVRKRSLGGQQQQPPPLPLPLPPLVSFHRRSPYDIYCLGTLSRHTLSVERETFRDPNSRSKKPFGAISFVPPVERARIASEPLHIRLAGRPNRLDRNRRHPWRTSSCAWRASASSPSSWSGRTATAGRSRRRSSRRCSSARARPSPRSRPPGAWGSMPSIRLEWDGREAAYVAGEGRLLRCLCPPDSLIFARVLLRYKTAVASPFRSAPTWSCCKETIAVLVFHDTLLLGLGRGKGHRAGAKEKRRPRAVAGRRASTTVRSSSSSAFLIVNNNNNSVPLCDDHTVLNNSQPSAPPISHATTTTMNTTHHPPPSP